MIQIDDADFAKLKKDADDNNQVKNIVRIIVRGFVAIALFLFVYYAWGRDFLQLDIQRRTAEISRELDVLEAENEVKIREIESAGMEMEDYLKWLEVKEKG